MIVTVADRTERINGIRFSVTEQDLTKYMSEEPVPKAPDVKIPIWAKVASTEDREND